MRKLVELDTDRLAVAIRLRDYANKGTEPRIVDGIEVQRWTLADVLRVALANGIDEWGESASDDPEWNA